VKRGALGPEVRKAEGSEHLLETRLGAPQRGDFAPAGGGRYLPSVLKSWPMKGFRRSRLASPILPPGLQTRVELGRRFVLVGRNMTAEGRDTNVELGVSRNQCFRVGLIESIAGLRRRRGAGRAPKGSAHNRLETTSHPAPRRGEGRACPLPSATSSYLLVPSGKGRGPSQAVRPDDLQGGCRQWP